MTAVQCAMCGSTTGQVKQLSPAELLSKTASIPIGLANIVITISDAAGYHYSEVRQDGRQHHMLAVRDKIIRRAATRRGRGGKRLYTVSQLSRALNRDRTAIYAVLTRLGLSI
jgi:hypothetical protein